MPLEVTAPAQGIGVSVLSVVVSNTPSVAVSGVASVSVSNTPSVAVSSIAASQTLSANEFTFSITASSTPIALSVPSGLPSLAYSFVLIYNNSSYTVYVGNASTQALPIAPGGQLSIDVKPGQAFNLASIYLNSASGASVVVFYA